MKKTLNDILLNYQSIEVELIENNGEITENIEKELLLNESDLEEKMDGYEKFTRYLKHQSEYLKSLEEHYNKRRKIIDNSVIKFKDRMIHAMKVTNNSKIKSLHIPFCSTSRIGGFQMYMIHCISHNNLLINFFSLI